MDLDAAGELMSARPVILRDGRTSISADLATIVRDGLPGVERLGKIGDRAALINHFTTAAGLASLTEFGRRWRTKDSERQRLIAADKAARRAIPLALAASRGAGRHEVSILSNTAMT